MWTRIGLAAATLLACLALAVVKTTDLADGAFEGTLPELTSAQQTAATRLAANVEQLSLKVGQRNVTRPSGLDQAVQHLTGELTALGRTATRHEFSAGGRTLVNLVVELPGTLARSEVVIVAAHYDSHLKSPSADASASGCAVLLELVRGFQGEGPQRTVRYVFLANGERPWRGTEDSGASRYAQTCAQRGDSIVAVVCLDALGYYAAEPGTQHFGFPLALTYPGRGDFVGIFGNPSGRALVERIARVWIDRVRFPLEAGALPAWFPGTPDGAHQAFAREGWPAVVFTDTREKRYPDVASSYDRHDRLDYGRMARVANGLALVVEDLARAGS